MDTISMRGMRLAVLTGSSRQQQRQKAPEEAASSFVEAKITRLLILL